MDIWIPKKIYDFMPLIIFILFFMVYFMTKDLLKLILLSYLFLYFIYLITERLLNNGSNTRTN